MKFFNGRSAESKVRVSRVFRPTLGGVTLESRQLLSGSPDTFTVTNANASGTGSASAAFASAMSDTNPNGVDVVFSKTLRGDTIMVSTGNNNPWNFSNSTTITGTASQNVTLEIPTGVVFRGTNSSVTNVNFTDAVAPGNTPADSALYVAPGDGLTLSNVNMSYDENPIFVADATFSMTGGSITNIESYGSYAVDAAEAVSFTMTNVTLTSDTLTTQGSTLVESYESGAVNMTGNVISGDTATNIVSLVGNGPNYGVTGRISYVSNLLRSNTGVGLTIADGNAQSAGLPASFVFMDNDAIQLETGTSVLLTGGNVDIDGVLVTEGTATTAAVLDEQALTVDALTSEGLSVTDDTNTATNGGGFADMSSVPASFTQGQFSGDVAKAGNGGGVFLASGSLVTFTNITAGDDTALIGGGMDNAVGSTSSWNSVMISNDVATADAYSSGVESPIGSVLTVNTAFIQELGGAETAGVTGTGIIAGTDSSPITDNMYWTIVGGLDGQLVVGLTSNNRTYASIGMIV